MKKYDKEFKNITEQLERLKNIYSLEESNDKLDEYNLKSFPYYNIVNGYKEHFMDKNNKYKNVNLDHLIKIHMYDKSFLNILFKYSTYIEDIFKHRVAYCISSKAYDHVDENIYLNPNNEILFDTPNNKILNDILIKSKTIKDEPTYYYRNKHNHIPAWILFKNIRFIDVTEYFKNLKTNIKLEIINDYYFYPTLELKLPKKKRNLIDKNNIKIKIFLNALNTVRKFRNRIGHNLKIYKYKLKPNVRISTNDFNSPIIKSLTNNRNYKGELFSCIISTFILLDNAFLASSFINDLTNFIILNDESNEYLKMYNFPQNFSELLDKLSKEYIVEIRKIITEKEKNKFKNELIGE